MTTQFLLEDQQIIDSIPDFHSNRRLNQSSDMNTRDMVKDIQQIFINQPVQIRQTQKIKISTHYSQSLMQESNKETSSPFRRQHLLVETDLPQVIQGETPNGTGASRNFDIPESNSIRSSASSQSIGPGDSGGLRMGSSHSIKSTTSKRLLNKIEDIVQDDDTKSLIRLNLSVAEIEEMRFDQKMNFLQLVCHEEALEILKWLTVKLNEYPRIKSLMVSYRDGKLGSQALHFASTTGNRELIEILLLQYSADLHDVTLGKQTVHHCAAQMHNGIASIFLFNRTYNLQVNKADLKGATALHFAVICVYIKNVQTLIKLGADPNVKDFDGNTPLHLAVMSMATNVDSFDKLKNIAKELLFCGASRNVLNNNRQSPLDLLNLQIGQLSDYNFKKMKYVLTTPTGVGLLRMTRPIEKVERSSSLQRRILIFDLVSVLFLIVAGLWQQTIQFNNEIYTWLSFWYVLTVIFFVFTVVFYLLTVFMDPGYVPTASNFQDLIQNLIKEGYHLDYVCVYCENLRPENADHCNFCNRCVQKFDHHCVFVNNCLGYRNHKWFILLLVSFTIFIIVLIIHSALALVAISVQFNTSQDKVASAFKLFIALYLIFIFLLHTPVVVLQVQSQFKKLCSADAIRGQADAHSSQQGKSTVYDKDEDLEADVEPRKPLTQWEALKFNLNVLFTFKPQSQEYLNQQLFGDCKDKKSDKSSDDDFVGGNHDDDVMSIDSGRRRSSSLSSANERPSEKLRPTTRIQFDTSQIQHLSTALNSSLK